MLTAIMLSSYADCQWYDDLPMLMLIAYADCQTVDEMRITLLIAVMLSSNADFAYDHIMDGR